MFKFNLSVRYKIDKINIVFNIFSRLLTDVSLEERQKILKSLYKSTIKYEDINVFELILIYYITLIEMDDDFKKWLIKTYYKN